MLTFSEQLSNLQLTHTPNHVDMLGNWLRYNDTVAFTLPQWTLNQVIIGTVLEMTIEMLLVRITHWPSRPLDIHQVWIPPYCLVKVLRR